MTLPTGTISMSQVNTELGYSSTATISLNQAAVRTLAGVPSGTISMNNLRGKSNQFAFTISSNQTNANLRTLAVNAGWNQSSKVVATINGGVYISSNNTGVPALTVNGSFPGGVQLTNNGLIIGMGGAGGGGATSGPNNTVSAGSAGSAGGPALSAQVAISINNAGTIGGGGGGGGAGRSSWYYSSGCFVIYNNQGGGGGGGGRSGAAANSSGGAQGAAISGGSCGVYYLLWDGLAGNSGTSGAAGTGGLGGYERSGGPSGYGRGGTGGGWGASGSTGNANYQGGGFAGPTSGGGGGNCTTSGSNANITWIATGTRLGTIG